MGDRPAFEDGTRRRDHVDADAVFEFLEERDGPAELAPLPVELDREGNFFLGPLSPFEVLVLHVLLAEVKEDSLGVLGSAILVEEALGGLVTILSGHALTPLVYSPSCSMQKVFVIYNHMLTSFSRH